jgi:hypothetical protein
MMIKRIRNGNTTGRMAAVSHHTVPFLNIRLLFYTRLLFSFTIEKIPCTINPDWNRPYHLAGLVGGSLTSP